MTFVVVYLKHQWQMRTFPAYQSPPLTQKNNICRKNKLLPIIKTQNFIFCSLIDTLKAQETITLY